MTTQSTSITLHSRIWLLCCLLVGLAGIAPEANGQVPTLNFGFDFNPSTIIRDVATDKVGNVYITGNFSATGVAVDFDPGAGVSSYTTAHADIFIAKYTPTGTFVWVDVLTVTDADRDGGVGASLAIDGNNNVYLTGYFVGTADFDPGVNTAIRTSISLFEDLYVAKYNTDGQFQWVNTVGNRNEYSFGTGVDVDAGGNVYITGSFGGTVDFDPSAGTAIRTADGRADAFLAKYDTNGNLRWVNAFVGPGSTDAGLSVALDPANNVYVTGYFENTADFDPSAGDASRTSAGNDDIFLVKFDGQGNFRWVNTMGGIMRDVPLRIAVDADGNAFITGYFRNTVDFDPSGGVASRTSAGEEDIFVARYNAQGNFVWVNQMGSTGYDVGNAIKVDAASNVYVTASFSSIVDFDPGANVASLTALNGGPATGGALAKYDAQGAYVWAKAVGANGAASNNGIYIALGATGNFFAGGRFNFAGNINFAPNSTTVSNGFLANYNEDVTTITVTDVTTTTTPLLGSPFYVGTDLFVEYKRTGTFFTGNIFTAQLSDAMGSFASPINIGTLPVTTGGKMNAKLPLDLSPGTHYRIRVMGSYPYAVGKDNGTDLTINSPLSLSASNLGLNGSSSLTITTCPTRLTGLGWGKSFVFTGPGGYVFSNVFRDFIFGGGIEARGIRLPGLYTLTVYGNPDQTPVVYSIQVTGQGCP